jgi:SanA protein
MKLSLSTDWPIVGVKRKIFSSRRLLVFLMAGAVLLFGPQLLAIAYFSNDIYTDLNDTPHKEYAIVFGALVHDDRQLSDVVRERIDAAILLHQQGKVKKLFISGDNRHNEEVATIARYAVSRGIAETDIVMDRLGIDTNDTCRHFTPVAQDAILVTQQFHLPRALFMCRQSGLSSSGLAVNQLGLLPSRGGNAMQIYSTRIFRFARESFLTWLFLLNLYDAFSGEAEAIEQGTSS